MGSKNSGLTGVRVQSVCKGNTKTGTEKVQAQKAATAQRKFNRVVETEMLDYLRDSLTAPDSKGVPYFQKYVSKFLKSALDEPNGVCSRMLSSGLFNEKLLQKLDSEAVNAMEKDQDFNIYRLRQTLFDKQREVFDNDYDKRIIVICSRRAGKTELNARKIIKTLMKKNHPVLYLNKTFDNAINQMWNLVEDICKKINFIPVESKKTDGYMSFANGSYLKFGGVNDIASIDKQRGFKYALVIVDEIAHIKNTQYLIDEVLMPATSDYADSQMIFTGTPPRTKNYAVKLWNSGIKKYHWTFKENPFIPNATEFIEEVCKDKGVTIDEPFIQREYFGVVGAFDMDAMVYRNYKTYDKLPSDIHIDKVCIGVDFGFVDYNAIVNVIVDNLHKKCYIYRCDKFNKAGYDEVVFHIRQAYENAQALLLENAIDDRGNIIIITDTNEPTMCFDLNKKYGLPTEKAYKYDKAAGINELASAMRTGQVLVHESLENVKEECEATVWKRDENDVIIPEVDDDVYHPDIMDAILYVSRNVFERWGKKAADPIPQPTPQPHQTDNGLRQQIQLGMIPPSAYVGGNIQSLGGMQL